MAIVVEDGTGKATANAYASAAEADAYFTERGVVSWTGASGVKEAALIRATDYIETRFAHKFKGEPEFPDAPQALSFPRTGIDDYTGVPVCLKKATYEYANRALVGPLAPDPVMDSTNRPLQGKRTKVGPIETELQYGAGAAAAAFRPYPAADALLRPLLAYSGGVTR